MSASHVSNQPVIEAATARGRAEAPVDAPQGHGTPGREQERQLGREVKRELGTLPALYRPLLGTPWLVRVLCGLGTYPARHLSAGLPELILLAVARDNACRYCMGIGRFTLEMLGYSSVSIESLERDIHVADLDPTIRQALAVARRISRFSPPPDRCDTRRLSELGMSPEAIAELVFVASRASFITRLASFFDLPDERIARLGGSLWLRLLRPLLRRSFESIGRRWRPRAPSAPLPAAFEPIVAPFDVLPDLAATIRWSIEQAWLDPSSSPADDRPARSTDESSRTSALITAVVARALGTEQTERAASALLGQRDLAGHDVAEILDRLTSPHLDADEVALLSVARDSARHHAAVMSDHVNDLRRRFAEHRVVGIAGASSLANWLCRLEVLAGLVGPAPSASH